MNHPSPETLWPDHLARCQLRFKEAVNRFNREGPPGPAGIFGGLFAFHWLRAEIHPRHRRAVLGVSRNPAHAWLATLLDEAPDAPAFVTRFLEVWRNAPPDEPKGAEIRAWEQRFQPDPVGALLAQWRELALFRESYAAGVRRIQREQKNIVLETGGPLDRERMALVDALPAPATLPPAFPKAGFIPRMACAQSCRHCLFVWRAPLKKNPEQPPARPLAWLNRRTDSILFTGGDLAGQLHHFCQAIREMDRVRAFAILLNGASATSPEAARALFQTLRQAGENRPAHAPPATITLQISFDEFHQEILADHRDGSLRERIPVACIANLLEAAVLFPDIALVLLHKQNRLNFSPELFRRGVFARLAREMERRGAPLRIVACAPSPRIKADPVDRNRSGTVIRDAMLTLASHPECPIGFMSSTIDAYGRAALLDPSEYLDERRYLQTILQHGPPAGERFDIDPMVRGDGEVSCFSASHLWLGNLFTEGEAVIEARLARDPLLKALERFDTRLLAFWGELGGDTRALVANATGPHHLFHRLTERAATRLHLTRRLLESD